MLPKGEQKKILKLLNSKHFIERLDALHELKDAGEHAAFAVTKLISLIQKDPDDLVIINALDILALLSQNSPELVSTIEKASWISAKSISESSIPASLEASLKLSVVPPQVEPVSLSNGGK